MGRRLYTIGNSNRTFDEPVAALAGRRGRCTPFAVPDRRTRTLRYPAAP